MTIELNTETYPENEALTFFQRSSLKSYGSDFVHADFDDERKYDICEECVDKFRKFVKQEVIK